MTFYLRPGGDSTAGLERPDAHCCCATHFRESPGNSTDSVLVFWRRVYEPTPGWLAELTIYCRLITCRCSTACVRRRQRPNGWQARTMSSHSSRLPRTCPVHECCRRFLLYTESLSTTKGMRLMGQRFCSTPTSWASWCSRRSGHGRTIRGSSDGTRHHGCPWVAAGTALPSRHVS